MSNRLMSAVHKKRVSRWMSMAAALVITMPSLAVAGGALFPELTETELAAIRGMYVSRSRVQYFGLSMRTQWASRDRSFHDVGMRVSLRMKGEGDRPKLSIRKSGSPGTKLVSASVPELEVDPSLGQIGGAVQSIQVSGVDNTVHNAVAINIVDLENVAGAAGAVTLPTGSQAYQTDNGVTTNFVADNGSLGYSVVTNEGIVTQALARNGISNTSQLLQAVNIVGNGQTILNSVRLDVALDNTEQLRSGAASLGLANVMLR
ncbi:MAG: hypothetical protein DRQ54_07965 [Gammaproteobacteria bacterium]|nr:MAG: hypothetical protein DRQ54_07965 [Gammaproteobacteria bacterium]